LVNLRYTVFFEPQVAADVWGIGEIVKLQDVGCTANIKYTMMCQSNATQLYYV